MYPHTYVPTILQLEIKNVTERQSYVLLLKGSYPVLYPLSILYVAFNSHLHTYLFFT